MSESVGRKEVKASVREKGSGRHQGTEETAESWSSCCHSACQGAIGLGEVEGAAQAGEKLSMGGGKPTRYSWGSFTSPGRAPWVLCFTHSFLSLWTPKHLCRPCILPGVSVKLNDFFPPKSSSSSS